MPNKVVFIEPDPFYGRTLDAAAYVPDLYAARAEEQYRLGISRAGEKAHYAFNSRTTVSRPLNGIVVKPDTHAVVQVRNASGKALQVFNRLGTETDDGYSKSYPPNGREPNDDSWTDWLLQSVHEERAEKTQIVETFGETYLYAFGQRPRVLAFSGILLNTADYNWRAVFWRNWDEYFRASQLIRANARMYISFDDIVVEGYPLNASADQLANDNNIISFSFTFFVTNYVNLVAQNDFASVRNNVTTVLRAGYEASADGTPVEYNISTNTNRIVDLFPGMGKLASIGPAGILLSNTTNNSDALATAINVALDPSKAKGIVSAPANAMTAQLALWRDLGVDSLERTLGVKAGDINTWFGFLSSILEKNAPAVANSPVFTFAASGQLSQSQLLTKAIQEGLDPSNSRGEGSKAFGIFLTGKTSG